ncbi:glycosyltransferase [Marinicrinis lubricantis]|uniref:Glycosyltransferase n=1 Tax=Marinicrinis lubricantis TaxID=2086470 RepID=A0ABW1IK31_9BACL
MKATIAICTHNRADELEEAIRSALDQDYNRNDFEVLVIDNRSTDATPMIVSRLEKETSGKLRYIYEEKLGLSAARNRAIKESKGEFILFLDDDAIACSNWIKSILSVFETDSQIGCVGGKIEPIWQGGEPTWISDQHKSLYSILDYSDQITEMPHPKIPFGANVAFRKNIFREMTPFREDLGRVGTNLLSNEESELISRIRKQYKVFYTPHGFVKHKIAKDRSTKKWILRRFYWQGISYSTVSKNNAAVSMAKHIIKWLEAAVLLIFNFYNNKKAINQLVKICYRNGAIVGLFRQKG